MKTINRKPSVKGRTAPKSITIKLTPSVPDEVEIVEDYTDSEGRLVMKFSNGYRLRWDSDAIVHIKPNGVEWEPFM